MNYKTRMLDELVYIARKVALLEKYCATAKDELLEKQLSAMRTYQECLLERLSNELQDKEQLTSIKFQEKRIKEEPITYGVTM